jgi:hypothetical protein
MTTGPGLSTFFFGGTGSADATAASSEVAAFWEALEPVMPGYGLWSIEPTVAEINAATGELEAFYPSTGEDGNGTDSSSQLPAQINGLLQVVTSSVAGGRLIRGRVFVPGPGEVSNETSFPTTTYRNTLQAAGNALLGGAATYGIWSRSNGMFYPATGVQVWNKWATLNSRRD